MHTSHSDAFLSAPKILIEPSTDGFQVCHWPICLLFGLFILLSCTSTVGQEVGENRWPEATREEGAFGEQLLTSNALRAPTKARRAVEKAERAMANDQPKEAQKQLSRALDVYPNYARALTLRAIGKMTTERSDSIVDLQRAIQIDPAYGVAYAVLASIYNDSQRYDDALAVIVRAMQLLPRSWLVHYEMARTLCGKHRNLEALREVTDAIQRMSADASAEPHSRATLHYLRGRLLIEQHEFANARVEFELTLKEEPQGNFAKSSNQILAQLESQGTR